MKEQLKKHSRSAYPLLKKSWYSLRRLNPFISGRFIYIGKGKYYDIEERQGVSALEPRLFIIGAEKSGTTSLHHYLDQHPEIFMSKPNKEPHYLLPLEYIQTYLGKSHIPVRDKNDLLKNHMLRGYEGQPIIGESTTTYTRGTTDGAHKIPQTIKRLGPAAQCVYIIRHPLERIISSYRHRMRLGLTDKTLAEDLKELPAYVYTSLYGRHVELFLKHLQREQLHVVFYEEFIDDPQKELSAIFRFLKLETVEVDTAKVFNKGSGKSAELSKKDSAALKKLFAADIKKLEKSIGRKAPWKF